MERQHTRKQDNLNIQLSRRPHPLLLATASPPRCLPGLSTTDYTRPYRIRIAVAPVAARTHDASRSARTAPTPAYVSTGLINLGTAAGTENS